MGIDATLIRAVTEGDETARTSIARCGEVTSVSNSLLNHPKLSSVLYLNYGRRSQHQHQRYFLYFDVGMIAYVFSGPNELKLTLSISLDKTVNDLKSAIAEKSDVEADRQRLIYSGEF